jgi:hypothetical protein
MAKTQKIVTEIDSLTGQSIVRPFNDEEIAQAIIDEANAKTRQAEAEAKIQAKAIAQGKLAALGLTVEDLQALGL